MWPGIEDSSRLRVRGEGDAGRKGGDMGDLYVFIKVRGHPTLKREGVGIHSTIDVSYVDAILGTNVKVSCCWSLLRNQLLKQPFPALWWVFRLGNWHMV